MSKRGRPLRFLGVILGGWVVVRVGAFTVPSFWQLSAPEPASLVAMARAEPAQSQRAASSSMALLAPAPPAVAVTVRTSPRSVPATQVSMHAAEPSAAAFALPAPQNPSISLSGRSASAPQTVTPAPAAFEPFAPRADTSAARRTSPWTLTGWLLWRRDAGATLAQAPLLGGSQGGLRVDYRLWSAGGRSLGLYGRVTRALDWPHAEEGAVGLSLRPVAGVPVTLLAERRQKLGTGGRSGFAFLAAGGIGPRPVAPRLEMEGYAEGGVVGLPGSDPFADGRLSLDYRLTGKSQPDVALGAVVSGAAQIGVSRVDIGPELRLRLPVAGGHVRLSAEWRERIAGRARPGSGPAVALVADF